jgi:hypothetical protein
VLSECILCKSGGVSIVTALTPPPPNMNALMCFNDASEKVEFMWRPTESFCVMNYNRPGGRWTDGGSF